MGLLQENIQGVLSLLKVRWRLDMRRTHMAVPLPGRPPACPATD